MEDMAEREKEKGGGEGKGGEGGKVMVERADGPALGRA